MTASWLLGVIWNKNVATNHNHIRNTLSIQTEIFTSSFLMKSYKKALTYLGRVSG